MLMLLVSCAGSPKKPEATHATYEAVNVQEASLDDAGYRTADPNAPCSDVCQAADEGCAAATRICELASASPEADLRARCAAAEHGCRRIRGEASRCPCATARAHDEAAP